MADVSRTVEILFKGDDQISPAIDDVETSLSGISREADNAVESTEQLGDELDSFDVYAENIKVVGAAMTALAAAVVVDRFVEVNSAAQKFNSTIQFATGSATRAAEEWDYLVKVSDRFGISLRETSDDYASFLVATSKVNATTDQTRGIFEAVAGSIAATGGSANDVSGALAALTKGLSQGNFELDELRSLADRIPGGMKGVAEALGLTSEELRKLVREGKFGTEEIVKVADALNNQLAGVKFDGFQTSLTRLNNEIDNLVKQIGDAGVFNVMTKGIQAVTATIVGATGVFELLGKTIWISLAAFLDGDFTLESKEYKAAVAEVFNEVTERSRVAVERLGIYGDASNEAFSKGADAANEQATAVDSLGDSLDDLDVGTLVNLDKAYEDVKESANRAAEQAARVALEMQKLAAQKEIAKIEGIFDLNIAQLEADAEIAVATIEGLAGTIEGTADLLGGLFDNLLDASNFRQEFAIEDQIELENERRQKQLDQQEKVNNALIKSLNARTKALNRGDALITIDGAALQPHLEAFMFEILEALQVRINADGYDMLLGAG